MVKPRNEKEFDAFMINLGIDPDNWKRELKALLDTIEKPSIDLNTLWDSDKS